MALGFGLCWLGGWFVVGCNYCVGLGWWLFGLCWFGVLWDLVGFGLVLIACCYKCFCSRVALDGSLMVGFTVGCVAVLALFCLLLLLVAVVLIMLIWYAIALAIGLCGIMLDGLFGCIWLEFAGVQDLIVGGCRLAVRWVCVVLTWILWLCICALVL